MALMIIFSNQMENSEIQEWHEKNSPIIILRNQNKAYTRQLRRKNKLMQRKKNLQEEIYKNNNIFHHSFAFHKRKQAQSILWQRTYQLKMLINLLKEENSSIRARLWNIEKQNRKMDKQIEGWSLNKLFSSAHKKPYIDMMTIEKVFRDQDYSIVSTKMEILEYEKIFQEKQSCIKQLLRKKEQYDKYHNHLNYLISENRVETLQMLANTEKSKISLTKDKLNEELLKVLKKIQQVEHNLDLKRKVKNYHMTELMNLKQDHELHKNINETEIIRLKHEVRKMQEEDIGCIMEVKESLREIEQKRLVFQCELQKKMGEYIKQKLEKKNKMKNIAEQIQERLQKRPAQLESIEPFIRPHLTQ